MQRGPYSSSFRSLLSMMLGIAMMAEGFKKARGPLEEFHSAAKAYQKANPPQPESRQKKLKRKGKKHNHRAKPFVRICYKDHSGKLLTLCGRETEKSQVASTAKIWNVLSGPDPEIRFFKCESCRRELERAEILGEPIWNPKETQNA
jgi:hypothetical protein